MKKFFIVFLCCCFSFTVNAADASTTNRAICEKEGGTWTPNEESDDPGNDGTCNCNIFLENKLEKATNDDDATYCKCPQGYAYLRNQNTSAELKGACLKVNIKNQFVVSKGAVECVKNRATFNGKLCCLLKETTATYDEKTDTCTCTNGSKSQPYDVNNFWNGSYCPNQSNENSKEKGLSTTSPGSNAGGDNVNISAIQDAINTLDKISKNFEDSVWKTAEGKFNTSRLISDSFAGVVLGTAGGLITSKVVKKNQVENGFEDIECSIGGQKVADWGDQFRVGIQ